MRGWIGLGALAAGGAGTAALAAASVGAWRWGRATARAVDRLTAPGSPHDRTATFSPERLSGLPAPVARYFQFALTAGQPLVRRTRLRQAGEFAVRPGAWRPFSAVQHFSAAPPGFVWDATIRMFPVIPVRVRDSYLGGEGAMYGAVASLFPVVDRRGTPYMASASLVRYLAEAVWLPTALLPGQGVAWELSVATQPG